jgi:acylphosphatase
MGITAVDVVVTGRVQGVFFRASMREQAELLGVAGWVDNEPDGSVRAHLEGEDDAVDSLVAWCSHGPPAAVVEDVRRTSSTVDGATFFRSD